MPNFQFDKISFFLGLLVGIGLAFAFYKASPFLRRQVDKVRHWARARISWMRSGVDERFRRETADYAQTAHLGQQWAKLSQIFTPPHLTLPPADSALIPEDRGAMQFRYVWPELAGWVGAPLPPVMTVEQLMNNGRRVIITGETGAGKSTLLAYMAYQAATAVPDGENAGWVEYLPALVHLAELNLALGEGESAVTPLVKALSRHSSPVTAPGIGDLLQRKLAAGQVLLLLDGWDEAAAELRPFVADWLRQLLADFPETRLFVAAGLEGYGALLDLGCTVTAVLPWRLGQAETFSQQWPAALNLEEPPVLTDFWQPGQNALETSLRFWRLVLGDGQPEDGRFYTLVESVMPLIAGPEKAADFEDEDVTRFWQAFAYRTLAGGKLSLTSAEIKEIATPLVADEAGELDKARYNRLRKSVQKNGLFGRWGSGLAFSTLVWRNFWAARHLAQANLTADVAAHLSDAAWQPAIRFYVAQRGAGKLAEAALARDGVFQAASWLAETTDSGPWRKQTLAALARLISQEGNPQLLRLRAAAALSVTGEKGVMTFLTRLLDSPKPFLRQMGTMALPPVADGQTAVLLARMLADEDGVARQTAAYSLLQLQVDPRMERPLLTALIGEDEAVSLLVAEGLARNGAPGIEILREAVEDEDVHVRRAAIQGLSLLDEAWVEPLLTKIERYDDEWFVRSAAGEAREVIRKRQEVVVWRPLDPAAQAWLAGYARQEKLVLDEDTAVSVLAYLLENSDQQRLRASAALLLGQLAALPAREVLAAAVTDPEPIVREAAYAALTQLDRMFA
ncbi:MAG: NACHT domain-containing protein [Chloroflexi bacterium]|nr:NACHT domain-containing protein [Chloroflexota bacterium]